MTDIICKKNAPQNEGLKVNCGDNAIISNLVSLSSKKYDNVDDVRIYVETRKNMNIAEIIATEKNYCGRYATVKTCSLGHRVAKRHFCQSEFCPVCSKNNSQAHNRRISRMMPYVFSYDSLGYFVFTLPENIRAQFLGEKRYKNKIQKFIKSIVKKYFSGMAVGRWHWFGDSSAKFHPHLNLFVDSSYINSEIIEKIKMKYKEYISKLFAINQKNISVNYHYYEKSEKIFHKIKYVCRSTVRKDADANLLMQLYTFLYKTKNTFIIGAKKHNIEKAEKRMKNYFLALQRTEKEIDEMMLEYHIQKKYSGNICPVCGRNHLTYLTEMREIYQCEIRKEHKNGYVLLQDEDIEVLCQRVEMERRRCEKQNEIIEKFWAIEYEKRLLGGYNYLDSIAITDNFEKKEKKYVQEILKLY